MKRRRLQILYGLLWILTLGLVSLTLDGFRRLAAVSGQAIAIAWFMILAGPFFLTLYGLTAFLFDVREDRLTLDHLKAFLFRRRAQIGLFLFSMILFVLLTFYGVSFQR